MREIKFRAWDTVHNEMVEPSDVTFSDNGHMEAAPCFLDSKFIALQFTGLKDKNGKDIYEGDVLKSYSDEIRTVEWQQESASYGMLGNLVLGAWEVIGNIYENSDLLK